jgi:prevent-host-death family protein
MRDCVTSPADERSGHEHLAETRPTDDAGVAGDFHCAIVCYMTNEEPPTVGVRELRQNLSVYLSRVKRGEAFAVTEHGHPVARLVPNVSLVDPLDRLLAEGRAVPPRRSHKDLPEPPRISGVSLGAILREMRDEDSR